MRQIFGVLGPSNTFAGIAAVETAGPASAAAPVACINCRLDTFTLAPLQSLTRPASNPRPSPRLPSPLPPDRREVESPPPRPDPLDAFQVARPQARLLGELQRVVAALEGRCAAIG